MSSSKGVIVRAVGLPDLHQGPTGVAILARRPMPKLPGCDIGCGMALFATRVPADMARDRVARCMARMDLDVGERPADPDFGTIGGGNHFAELLVLDPDVTLAPEISDLLSRHEGSSSCPSDLYGHALLLVHSGSRGHGAEAYSEHSDGHDLDGYMKAHLDCVEWARRNRAEIARRFLAQFSGGAGGGANAAGEHDPPPATSFDGIGSAADASSPSVLVDIAHNWIEPLPDGTFLHRKGAAPSRPGSLSLLPGSRATSSYVLVCDGRLER